MQIIVRASVMFLFLWFVLRMMGRKELAQLSPFELLLLVVMGDLIQQGVTQQDSSIVGAMLAISTFALWILLFSYLSFRFRRVGQRFEGEPVIVIRDGRPLAKMLGYERITLDELKDAAREQGIADLRQVWLGVLESDGKFSFLRYDGERPPVADDVET